MFDVLVELMKDDVPPIGCVIMSGNNTTLFTICGTEIIQHVNIEENLPNKHGRGGQSKARFERLAEEARHNYVSKIIELILRTYSSDVPLIVGGPAYLKERMVERLRNINTAPTVLKVLDIQYDKRQGLYELLRHSEDIVSSVQTAKERKWINIFMSSISAGDNLSVYGDKSVEYCLTNGFINTLIVHEDIFTEDLVITCEQFGTELVLISDFLSEASQLKMGFGGKVGMLRYPITIPDEEVYESEQEEYEW